MLEIRPGKGIEQLTEKAQLQAWEKGLREVAMELAGQIDQQAWEKVLATLKGNPPPK